MVDSGGIQSRSRESIWIAPVSKSRARPSVSIAPVSKTGVLGRGSIAPVSENPAAALQTDIPGIETECATLRSDSAGIETGCVLPGADSPGIETGCAHPDPIARVSKHGAQRSFERHRRLPRLLRRVVRKPRRFCPIVQQPPVAPRARDEPRRRLKQRIRGQRRCAFTREAIAAARWASSHARSPRERIRTGPWAHQKRQLTSFLAAHARVYPYTAGASAPRRGTPVWTTPSSRQVILQGPRPGRPRRTGAATCR